ncbi:sporulation protein [Pontibacillus salipaludis]|uniref:Sporulation-control protein n=1 Tax=Pontibacillus salipaludis TaxID=1697394 RepID=A0ABQ1QDS4_9BACI|nr:sporulation protein [Pontibacillus salipaludis]GGD24283.1 sporulation-control protein [Pontibacillus salipaludis]
MFKKIMASIGVGAAKVDTQLEKERFSAGEEVRGKVVMKGGNAEQQIDRINLFLMTEVVKEKDDRKVREEEIIHSFNITESFTLKEGEDKEIDFSFKLPLNTPASFGRLPIWFQTGLDIPMAIDPQDRDFIHVDPAEPVQTILTALQHELGFSLRKVEMEEARNRQIVQEFEFLPGGRFRGDLDELEVVFFPQEDGVELVLEVDRRAKGLGGLLAEAFDADESHVRTRLTNADIANGERSVANQLEQLIARFAN